MRLTRNPGNVGYIYIETSDGGVVKHMKNSLRDDLEIEYARLLRQINRQSTPYIELEKGHAIFIRHIVEIWIRYD